MKLFEKDDLLRHAHVLITKPEFSKEDAARANALMDLAGRIGPNGTAFNDPEMRAFEKAIRTREFRDMGEAVGADGGYFVPQAFRELLTAALKQYDRLFDQDVVTILETKTGSPIAVPVIDDTGSVATLVSEAGPIVETDPTAEQVLLASAPTYRSGTVKASSEFLQDSAFDPLAFLSKAFAVRFGRGIGPTLVSTLLAGAKLGATATGDKNTTGATGATSFGYQDLLALRKSVDPAYRASGKVFWVLNDNTLTAIDGLLDKQGHPILDADDFDANGNRLLLGYPVAICPSMPDIAASAKCVAFGATGYFVVRTVPSSTAIKPIIERWAEYGQVGFQSYLRCNAGLLAASGADSPVKVLQNSAT